MGEKEEKAAAQKERERQATLTRETDIVQEGQARASVNPGKILLTDNRLNSLNFAGHRMGENVVFDVVNDFPWTLTDTDKRLDVPWIELREFEIDLTQLWQQLKYWLDGTFTKSDTYAPYVGLYHAEPTGCVFRFPFFESYDHLIEPQWEKFKSPVEGGGLIAGIAGAFAALGQLGGVAPGSIINQPQVFKGSNTARYPVKFTLYNTGGSTADTTDIIKKNLMLKRRLQMSTLHSQMSRLFVSPPAIFEVRIPGIRFSPAAIINVLNITNVGQMNLMIIDGREQIIPDAYEFEINITELIVESREILFSEYDMQGTTPKIQAIISQKQEQQEAGIVTQVSQQVTKLGKKILP